MGAAESCRTWFAGWHGMPKPCNVAASVAQIRAAHFPPRCDFVRAFEESGNRRGPIFIQLFQ